MPVHEVLDVKAKPGRMQPVEGEPAWLYTGLLLVLAAIQVAIVVLACRMIGMADLLSIDGIVDLLVGRLVVGTSAGLSGIVVAHELMHRPSKGLQFLSRLLMGSVLYEHFFTEHVRGHHVHVGTYGDPATARFGEDFKTFYRRTVPVQFLSAWAIEIKRNTLEDTLRWHPRNLNNRVVQGIIGEVVFMGVIGWQFGVGGVIMLVLVGTWAFRLLEAVSYITMVKMVLVQNEQFMKIATEQLKARNLGPFREAAGRPTMPELPASRAAQGC